VCREAFHAGGKILTDFSKNESPDVRVEDIIPKHVGDAMSKHGTESTVHLISKLPGRRRKRVQTGNDARPGRQIAGKTTTKRTRVIKTGIVS